MRNEQQIVELAKKIRREPWMRDFRAGMFSSGSPAKVAKMIDDICDAIDPPQPVGVDWEKAIQRRDGRLAEYRGEIACHDYTKLVLVTDPEDGQQYPDCYSPEGRFTTEELIQNDPRDIINTPDPAPIELAESPPSVRDEMFNAFQTANILHAYINERRSVQKIIRRLVRTLRGPNLTEDEIEALGATLEEALFPNPAEIL